MHDVTETRPALSPSERLRTAVLIGGTVTLDQAFVADLLAEIGWLKSARTRVMKLTLDADGAVAAATDKIAAASEILDQAVARHRSAMRLLGITVLVWLVGAILLVGGWL